MRPLVDVLGVSPIGYDVLVPPALGEPTLCTMANSDNFHLPPSRMVGPNISYNMRTGPPTPRLFAKELTLAQKRALAQNEGAQHPQPPALSFRDVAFGLMARFPSHQRLGHEATAEEACVKGEYIACFAQSWLPGDAALMLLHDCTLPCR